MIHTGIGRLSFSVLITIDLQNLHAQQNKSSLVSSPKSDNRDRRFGGGQRRNDLLPKIWPIKRGGRKGVRWERQQGWRVRYRREAMEGMFDLQGDVVLNDNMQALLEVSRFNPRQNISSANPVGPVNHPVCK